MLSKSDIQRLRSLQDKKYREASGLFAVEGEKVVGELLAEGFSFSELYHTAAWSGRPSASMRSFEISEQEMARISHFPTPSSVLAVAPLERRPLVDGALNAGLTLALDGVQDAGNVGTLLRIADWYGFDRVLLSLDCADPFGAKVINASKASFARVAFHSIDLSSVLKGLVVPVFGCDLDGESVHQLKPVPAAVVVIGSEGRGLSPAVRACVTRFLTIPKFGRAESLNAGVAAGIVCDALRRP